MHQRDLWHRIEAVPIRLGRQGQEAHEFLTAHFRCSRDEAAALIGEYRRFLYLAAIADQIIAPSHAIDALWHMQLKDGARWRHYCQTVLGGDLQHLKGRAAPHRDPAYRQTLLLYRREFAHAAPRAFWPRPWTARLIGPLRWGLLGLALALWIGLGGGLLWFFALASGWLLAAWLLDRLIGTFMLHRKAGRDHQRRKIGCGALMSDGKRWSGTLGVETDIWMDGD